MNVTIEMIAEKAQVSRGTVDRVIHNRGRVNPETAEKIRKIMEELDYQANPLGRAFSLSQQKIQLGVLVSFKEADFLAQVMAGIQSGISYAEQYGLHVLLRTVDADDEEACLDALNFFQHEGVRGIAMKGLSFPQAVQKIHALQKSGIQIVTFNTDMDSSCRTCFVGQNHVQSGACAAYLMRQLCGEPGEILIMSLTPEHHACSQRIDSFCKTLRKLAPELRPTDDFYCLGENQLSYQIVQDQLRRNRQICGVFASGAGLSGICRGIAELGLAGQVKVIGFDSIKPNMDYLKQGVAQFLIDQSPYQQGYRPLQLLTDSLFLKQPISQSYYDTGIEIRTPYN